MDNEPELVQRSEQPYVAIPVRVGMSQLAEVVPPLNAEVFGWLAEHGGQPAGPPFWKYNVIDMEGELEIEAGVAVAAPISGDDRVIAGTLPGGTYATVTHTGHPDGLANATGALLDYGARQGWRWDVQDTPDGERWTARLEFYLTDPAEEPDMEKWQTQLAFRVAT